MANAHDPKADSSNPIEKTVENLMQTSEEVPDGSGSQDHSDPRTEVHSNLAQGLNSDNESFKARHKDQ